MIFPNGHIDYLMYEDGGALIGVAKVSMPPIKYKTVTATGAALMGDVTIPLASMIEPMTVKIDFSSVTDAIMQLGTNEWHDVALYLADQYFDGVTRKEELEPVRFEMSIRPIEINQGTIQTASAADASGTYSVCKYTVYKNEQKIMDIDQFNQIHEINGVDNAAAVRKALGMM